MNGRGIVVISAVPWDYLPIAPQQTARHLASFQPLLYVERQRSMAGLLIEPRKAFTDLCRMFRGTRRVDAEGVHVLTPPFAAPRTARSRPANILSMKLLGLSARRAAAGLGFSGPVVISYLPQAHFLKGLFGESLFVYDVIDEYSAFPGMDRGMCRTMEEEACRKADMVVAISERLVEDRARWSESIHHLPIGAESARFNELPRGWKKPSFFDGLPGPVLGYYGSIDGRLDVDFCAAAARAFPGGSLCLFGPVRDEEVVEPLRDIANIHFPGPVPYDELPLYCACFDVCLLPYKRSRFNEYIFPNKIFEYLASGKPVVVSPVPSLEYLARRGVLEMAATAGDFADCIARVLEEDDEPRRRARVACAMENTWKNRAERLWSLVVESLNGRRAA